MRNKLTKITLTAIFALAITFTLSCSSDSNDDNKDINPYVFEYDIGDVGPGGGIIFYRSDVGFTMTDDNSKAHYLEVATQNITSSLAWSTKLRTEYNISIPGTGTAIGTGRKNTELILAKDVNAPAAKACSNLSAGEKNDWFLPSKDELEQLYKNKNIISDAAAKFYWSSSEQSIAVAYAQNFSDGKQSPDYKDSKNLVLAIRAFGVDNSPHGKSSSSGGGGSSSSVGNDNSSNSSTVAGSCDIKDYKTKQIGDQVWMAENMNCNVSGSLCYNNDLANCAKYGRMYDWATAKTVCPDGWHLPSNAEWYILINYAGGYSTAGTKLKATSGWDTSSDYISGTDDFGFSALPGGNSGSSVSFNGVGSAGSWWSSSGFNNVSAYTFHMEYNYEKVSENYRNLKSFLFSVRCVRD
jgi:uncharacterized protein (TIGR02145 family)